MPGSFAIATVFACPVSDAYSQRIGVRRIHKYIVLPTRISLAPRGFLHPRGYRPASCPVG